MLIFLCQCLSCVKMYLCFDSFVAFPENVLIQVHRTENELRSAGQRLEFEISNKLSFVHVC